MRAWVALHNAVKSRAGRAGSNWRTGFPSTLLLKAIGGIVNIFLIIL
jgi:hypothetical protein